MRGFGGAERDRTAGLLVANEALSQLSYSPTTQLVYQLATNQQRQTGSPFHGLRGCAGVHCHGTRLRVLKQEKRRWAPEGTPNSREQPSEPTSF